MLSSGILWNKPHVTCVSLEYIQAFRPVCMQRKIQALDKWDTPWYTTQKHWISILYHPKENT